MLSDDDPLDGTGLLGDEDDMSLGQLSTVPSPNNRLDGHTAAADTTAGEHALEIDHEDWEGLPGEAGGGLLGAAGLR